MRDGLPVKESRSIFNQQFSVLLIDEVHEGRNRNNLHEAMYRIAENTDFTVGMTATLIWTGPTVCSKYDDSFHP